PAMASGKSKGPFAFLTWIYPPWKNGGRFAHEKSKLTEPGRPKFTLAAFRLRASRTGIWPSVVPERLSNGPSKCGDFRRRTFSATLPQGRALVASSPAASRIWFSIATLRHKGLALKARSEE